MNSHNNIIQPAIALFFAILSSGCTEIKIHNDGESVPVSITSVCTIPSGRAVIEGDVLTSEDIPDGLGLFLLDDSGKIYGNNPGNARFFYSDGKWYAMNPVYVGPSQGSIYAYSPYNESVSDVTAIPVKSSLNGDEFLYSLSQKVTSASASSVCLTMNHALSRLTINLRKDESYYEDCILQSITVEGASIAVEGTLDATTGHIDAKAAALSVTGLSQAVTDSGITEEFLLVPAGNLTTPQEATLSFVIDGKECSLKCSGDNALDIRSGAWNSVTISVKNEGIVVEDSSFGIVESGKNLDITLGGQHNISVGYADYTGIGDDVIINAGVSGETVVIRAYSISGNPLICNLSNAADLTSEKKGDHSYTFTVTDIKSDITATVGYVPVNVSTQFISIPATGNNVGNVSIEGECYIGAKVKLTANSADAAYHFLEWRNPSGTKIKNNIPYETVLSGDTDLKAVFVSTDFIAGSFSIGEGRRVLISKGNLWCDTRTNPTANNLHFEGNQYLYGNATDSHIEEFMWNETLGLSVASEYDNLEKMISFFAAKNLEIGGINNWRSLTFAEWRYLYATKYSNTLGDCIPDSDNKVRTGRYKDKVIINSGRKYTVCVLVPDDWDLDANPISDTYDAESWAAAEAAGAVCLPRGGYWTTESDSKFNVAFSMNTDGTCQNSSRDMHKYIRLVMPLD